MRRIGGEGLPSHLAWDAPKTRRSCTLESIGILHSCQDRHGVHVLLHCVERAVQQPSGNRDNAGVAAQLAKHHALRLDLVEVAIQPSRDASRHPSIIRIQDRRADRARKAGHNKPAFKRCLPTDALLDSRGMHNMAGIIRESPLNVQLSIQLGQQLLPQVLHHRKKHVKVLDRFPALQLESTRNEHVVYAFLHAFNHLHRDEERILHVLTSISRNLDLSVRHCVNLIVPQVVFKRQTLLDLDLEIVFVNTKRRSRARKVAQGPPGLL